MSNTKDLRSRDADLCDYDALSLALRAGAKLKGAQKIDASRMLGRTHGFCGTMYDAETVRCELALLLSVTDDAVPHACFSAYVAGRAQALGSNLMSL